MSQIRFEDEALLEFLEAGVYYELKRPGYGLKFEDEIEVLLTQIAVHPESGKNLDGYPPEMKAQGFFLSTFPFMLVVLRIDDKLTVHAVADLRKPLDHWRKLVLKRLK